MIGTLFDIDLSLPEFFPGEFHRKNQPTIKETIMQVNNKNRNDSIHSDNFQNKADQKIKDSGEPKLKKPSLHQKGKKYLSSDHSAGQSHPETLSHEERKQVMNRFNTINSHLQFKDDLTDADVVASTKDKSVKNEKPSTLEIASKSALEDDQNQKFQKYLGIRSPAAEKLINQLKIEQENSTYYDLDSIEQNIIKKTRFRKRFTAIPPNSWGRYRIKN
jgi:hypothetical protein